MEAVRFPEEGDYGTAVLSRFPIQKVEKIPILPALGDEKREPRCIVRAEIASDHFPLTAEFELAQ